MVRKPKTFTVIYRTGGPERCEWRDVWIAYGTRAAAAEGAAKIEAMGYKTLIFDTATLAAVGMPVGWEA